MFILPRLIDRFNAIPVKTQSGFVFFCRLIDKMILKCMWIDKGMKSSFRNNFENNNKVGTSSLPSFRTSAIVLLRTIVWYLQKDRHRSIEQNKEPRESPHKYAQLSFEKGAKAVQWGESWPCDRLSPFQACDEHTDARLRKQHQQRRKTGL